MTAELLLVFFLFAATAVAAGVGALILAAFGPSGWFVILALAVTAALAARLAAAHLASRARWSNEDLRDDWRAS
jgi:uncharacterized membrane protein YgaE (UPF0421/DUF939 family)